MKSHPGWLASAAVAVAFGAVATGTALAGSNTVQQPPAAATSDDVVSVETDTD